MLFLDVDQILEADEQDALTIIVLNHDDDIPTASWQKAFHGMQMAQMQGLLGAAKRLIGTKLQNKNKPNPWFLR